MRLALRTFLSAALLGGMLAPVASGQFEEPIIYQYSDIWRDGGTVLGYVETDLWLPMWYCGWGCGGFCWEWYTSVAQGTLYFGENYEWMGEYWYEQPVGPAWLWIWSDVDVGVWRLRPEHHIYDLLYQDSYCWEWEAPDIPYVPQYWQWPAVTVDPEISICCDYYRDDNVEWAAYYTVTSEVGTPTSYEWSFDYTPGGGNSPQVSFSAPSEALTMTNAHWYAHPDHPCMASTIAPYTVTATVGFSHGQATATAGLAAQVTWNPGGTTGPPPLTGTVTKEYNNGGGFWFVSATNFSRGTPPIDIAVPTTSQFRNKVEVHENVHVAQFEPGRIFGNMFLPSQLHQEVIGLTDPTESGLENKIQQAYIGYLNTQNTLLWYMQPTAEQEAYAVSNQEDPRYLYQTCP
jgi:hypothetical protein